MHLRSQLVGPRGFVTALRAGLYVLLCTVLLMLGGFRHWWPALLALSVIAILATFSTLHSTVRIGPAVEIGAAALVIGLSEPDGATLLPYLLAPRWRPGCCGASGRCVVDGRARPRRPGGGAVVAGPDRRAYAAYPPSGSCCPWWRGGRGLGAPSAAQRHRRAGQASYDAAYRLLSQLRVVSRQLSGGLDAYSPGPGDPGERCGSSALLPRRGVRPVRGRPAGPAGVRQREPGRLACRPSTTTPSGRRPGASGRPSAQPRARSPTATGATPPSCRCASGVRVVGLVGVERLEAPFHPEELLPADAVVAEAALRIETALLFSEVRQIATAEERRRLAREIHDGIAQELASLGYVMDDMSYRAADDEQRESTAEPAQRADPDHLRAAAVDLRPAQRGAGHQRPRRGPVRLRADRRRHLRPHRAPRCSTSPRSGCAPRPRPSCCGSPRRPSPTSASTPGAQNLWVTVPDRAAERLATNRGRRARVGAADVPTVTAWRSCANARDRLGADLVGEPRDGGGTVVEVAMGEPRTTGRPPTGRATEGGARVHDGAAR